MNKGSSKNLIRLNKYIAMCGIASRRKADELITQGKVRVNGKTISELGTMVNPSKDQIFVKNKPTRTIDDKVYVAFNKPSQVVSTMNNPEGRPCLRDFFTKLKIRLFPIGKLDVDAEGLILLTNDGEFAQKIADPKSTVANTYHIKLSGQPSDAQLEKLVRGVSVIGGKAHALAAQRMASRGSDKYDWIKVIIAEKSNRQIHLIFSKLGFDIKKMQRVAIGSLKTANLKPGTFKILEDEDLKKIFKQPV